MILFSVFPLEIDSVTRLRITTILLIMIIIVNRMMLRIRAEKFQFARDGASFDAAILVSCYSER